HLNLSLNSNSQLNPVRRSESPFTRLKEKSCVTIPLCQRAFTKSQSEARIARITLWQYNGKVLWRYHHPSTQQAGQQLSFGPHLFKPDTLVFHNELFKRHIHGTGLPDLADDRQRHRMELGHSLPGESDLQALSHPIVSEATNPAILDDMMFGVERFDHVYT